MVWLRYVTASCEQPTATIETYDSGSHTTIRNAADCRMMANVAGRVSNRAPFERGSASEPRALLQRLKQERGRVWIVGHRGAMGYCPENTLASFERGLELGADWTELDVHLSSDGAPIVIHDELLDRTTNGHGLVREHTLEEL